MDIHSIPIRSVWAFLRWLPAAILRKVFPKARLGELQYIDVMPRNDGVTIDLSEAARYQVMLQIINLSPFSVELDRAEFSFYIGGAELKSSVLFKQTFEPGVPRHLTISDNIPHGHANQIGRNLTGSFDTSASISGWIAFHCDVHPFVRQITRLDGIRTYVVNLEWRKALLRSAE